MIKHEYKPRWKQYKLHKGVIHLSHTYEYNHDKAFMLGTHRYHVSIPKRRSVAPTLRFGNRLFYITVMRSLGYPIRSWMETK